MTEKKGFLIDVRRFGNRGIILLYYDVEKQHVERVFVENFHPQFYTDFPLSEGTLINEETDGEVRVKRISETIYDTSYGKVWYTQEKKFDVFRKKYVDLWKANTEVSWDVPKIAMLHGDSYEHDIPYESVYLHYNNLSLISQQKDILKVIDEIMYLVDHLRILAFDIEVDNSTGKITAITCKSAKGVLILKGDEVDILKRFRDILANVDVLIGWYSNVYDVPMIINRCEHYKGDQSLRALKEMFVKRIVKFGAVEWVFDLKHGIHVDFYFPIKRAIITKQTFADYKLDTVVRELFGFNHYLKQNQGELEKLDEKTFDDYCRLDGEATWCFTKYLPFLFLTSWLSGVSVSRIGLVGQSLIADGFYIYYLRWKYGNILIPSLHDCGGSEIKGSTVLRTVGGIHDDVTCLDFKTQFGNIVVKYNISPENVNCSHDDCPSYRVERRQTKEQVKLGIKTYETIKMCNKHEGVLVEIVKYTLEVADILRKERNRWKGDAEKYKLYSDFYDAFKTIRNVIAYGYNLSPMSRFGDSSCGRLIVWLGAKTIQDAMNVAIGYFSTSMAKDLAENKIKYGDTDSLFVQNCTQDLIKRIQDVTGLEEDIDGVGTLILREHAKKKYILITHDGKSKVRGIRLRRKDTASFISSFQRYSVKRMEKAKNYEQLLHIHQKLIKDAKWVLNVIPSLSLNNFVMSQGVNSFDVNSPRVRAFNQLKEANVPFDISDKVKFVYVEKWIPLKTKNKLTFDAVAYQLFDYEKHRIHYDKYRLTFVTSLSDLFGRVFKMKKTSSAISESAEARKKFKPEDEIPMTINKKV